MWIFLLGVVTGPLVVAALKPVLREVVKAGVSVSNEVKDAAKTAEATPATAEK